MQIFLQWKSVSITCSECVFVANGIQHAIRMHHTDMWTARLYDIVPHFFDVAQFSNKKKKLNMKCVL
jgi:hypothetical protein